MGHAVEELAGRAHAIDGLKERNEAAGRFQHIVGGLGLAPGATSDPIVLQSNLGYTGSDQSRQEMLQNTHFVDAKVQLTAKYSNIQWVRMGEYPIERKLLTK